MELEEFGEWHDPEAGDHGLDRLSARRRWEVSVRRTDDVCEGETLGGGRREEERGEWREKSSGCRREGGRIGGEPAMTERSCGEGRR